MSGSGLVGFQGGEFARFAARVAPSLVRCGYLLTGDRVLRPSQRLLAAVYELTPNNGRSPRESGKRVGSRDQGRWRRVRGLAVAVPVLAAVIATVVVSVVALTSLRHHHSSAAVTPTSPTIAPKIGNIAFLRDGSLDVIHTGGAFPGEVWRVTPPGTTVWAYAWSPNGERIAYIDANDGSLWLYGLNSASGRRLLLVGSTLASSALSWSPDGREIAILSPGPYTKGSLNRCGGRRIYLVPIDGSRPTELRVAASGCDGIAWSPRGNEIAYGGHGGYFVIHPDGSGRLLVAPGGWGWVDWSADGTQLAFAVALGEHNGAMFGRYQGIAVVDADGSDFHIVTTKADNEYPAVWSPTGHRLLYGRANSGGIYVIDANGRNDHRVTTEAPLGSEWPALAWAPDGNSIVYDASQGGLYQVSVNGQGKIQLASPPNHDLDPSWVSPF